MGPGGGAPEDERVSGRSAALAVAALLLLGACGDDDEGDDEATTTTTTEAEATTTSTTATTAPTTASTEAPSTDNDPNAAAEVFMLRHFPGSNAALGDFQQGDSQSGEVEVLRPREGGGTANLASTLLLRLVDSGEWVVIGAVNPNVTIESPENGGEVPAGPITVSGAGRGFEAAITGRAVDADGQVVAEGFGSGGAQADPLPYEIELDLSGVPTGSELVLIAAGGVGLDQDTGEFSVVRVTVGG